MNKTKISGVIWFLFGLSIILSFIAGLSLGTNIFIPENIEIGLDDDTQSSMSNFESVMENVSNSWSEACENISYNCECDLDLGDDSLKYVIDRYEEVEKLRRTNYRIVDNFCKVENREGVYIRESKELYMMELNEPLDMFNQTFEIIGASGYDGSIVVDINGARKTMVEGDCFSNGKVEICANDIFVTSIPLLTATGNFDIKEMW